VEDAAAEAEEAVEVGEEDVVVAAEEDAVVS
jgi:hypothetical protein